jgi:RNA polymerase sigma factor for flagellar operon FliA
VYAEQTAVIDAVLAHICGARRLTTDFCEEFSSWVRLRLLENDSAILRKFGGRSSPRTFLMTVVQRLYLDWRNKEWGKWRPSAAARRAGPVAIELERLILRDHAPFEEAVETLLSRGIAQSRTECDAAWAALPQRPYRRQAGEQELESAAAPASTDPVVLDEQQARANRTSAALADVLTTLDAADLLVIRLRFQEGFTVARIAQLVGKDQKVLYRHIEQILNRLRQALLRRGVSASEVIDLLGSPMVDFPSLLAGKTGK